jgi:hypothetical protein
VVGDGNRGQAIGVGIRPRIRAGLGRLAAVAAQTSVENRAKGDRLYLAMGFKL